MRSVLASQKRLEGRSPRTLRGRLSGALGLSVFIALAFEANVSNASPAFPATVQTIAGLYTLECVPDCTLCHTASPGSIANLGPFARKLLSKGVPPGGTSQVVAAIKSVAEEMPPSNVDGDDMSDIDELKAGRNPNFKGPNDAVCSGLRYGCGAHVAPTSSVDHLGLVSALLVGLGLAAVTWRRRTR